MNLVFVRLTHDLARAIEPWFDDADTVRSLGGRQWVHHALHLMSVMPGFEMDGTRVLDRSCYVVEEHGRRVALLDIEVYDDLTASLALVVAPDSRGRGVGRRVVTAMWELPEMIQVKSVFGSIDADNPASLRCFAGAGATITTEPDRDGMLRAEMERPAIKSTEP